MGQLISSFQELYRASEVIGCDLHFPPGNIALVGSVSFIFGIEDKGYAIEKVIRFRMGLSNDEDLKPKWLACGADTTYLADKNGRLPFYGEKRYAAKNAGLFLLSRLENPVRGLSPGTVVFPSFEDPSAYFLNQLGYPKTPAKIGIVLDTRQHSVLVLWDGHSGPAITCLKSDLKVVNFYFTQEELDGLWTSFCDRDVWERRVRHLCPTLSKIAEHNLKQSKKAQVKQPSLPENISQQTITSQDNELQTKTAPSGCREQKGQANRSKLQACKTSMGSGYSGNVYRPGQCKGQTRSSPIKGTAQKFGSPGGQTRSAGTGNWSGGTEGGIQRAVPRRTIYQRPGDAVMYDAFECPKCGEDSLFCTRHHTGTQSGRYECVNEDCGHTEYNP